MIALLYLKSCHITFYILSNEPFNGYNMGPGSGKMLIKYLKNTVIIYQIYISVDLRQEIH